MKNVVIAGSAPAASSESAQSSVSLKSDALFAKIIEEVKKNPAKAKSVNAVYVYNVTENGKTVKQWSK